jgi:hypothetical protein
VSRRRPRIPGTRTRRVLFVLPSIPDELDPAAKNALAIRNACTTEGFCRGCGAVGVIRRDRELAGLWHYVFEHENWCPVVSDEDAAA